MNDDFSGGTAVMPVSEPDARLDSIEEKLDEVVRALTRITHQQEMVGDLKEDLMPMANGIIHLASQKLHDMETEGSLEDLRTLGSNLLPVVALLNRLTDPQVLALGAGAADGLASAAEAKPVGVFGAAGALRDPDVKKGMGVLMHLLKALGKAAG